MATGQRPASRRTATRIAPQLAKPYFRWGLALTAHGNTKGAVHAFQRALALVRPTEDLDTDLLEICGADVVADTTRALADQLQATPHAPHAALDAVRGTGGWAAYASDRAMTRFARMMSSNEGLNVLPASTAGLIALLEGHARDPLPNDRYVVVLTGRR